MSRSRKNSPVCKESNNWFFKRQANKKARKTDISSGGMYKKVYNSYAICDYWQSMWTADHDDEYYIRSLRK